MYRNQSLTPHSQDERERKTKIRYKTQDSLAVGNIKLLTATASDLIFILHVTDGYTILQILQMPINSNF